MIAAQHESSVDVMGEIDSWPQPWRLVCHQIGYRNTVEMMQDGMTAQQAADWAETGLEFEEWEDAGEDPDPVLGRAR